MTAVRRSGLRERRKQCPCDDGFGGIDASEGNETVGPLSRELAPRGIHWSGRAADVEVWPGDRLSGFSRGNCDDISVNASDRQALSHYTEASAPNETHKWEGHMADDISATDGPEPMALLIATSDSLFLSSTRGNFKIPRSAVTKLGKGKFYPWFFSAVRIHHSVREFPTSLQFKPLRAKPADVMNALRSLGYPAA